MPEQQPVAGAQGRHLRAEGDSRDRESTLRTLWRVIVSRKLAVRVLAAVVGALALDALGSSKIAGLAGLVLGSLLGEQIDELARSARTRNIWLLSALLGFFYLIADTVVRWVRRLLRLPTSASAAAPAPGATATAPAAPILSGGALASAAVACTISAAVCTASAAAGGPSPIPGPDPSDGPSEVEILGFSSSEPAKLGKLPRDSARPGETYRTCDPTGLWAVVRFERGNARFSAQTTIGERPFASYRGRAQGGFAQLKAHSYGAAIPTGRWNWKILVGGKERAKAEVTLVASCP
jgi:hypothetical protein